MTNEITIKQIAFAGTLRYRVTISGVGYTEKTLDGALDKIRRAYTPTTQTEDALIVKPSTSSKLHSEWGDQI